MRFLRLMLLAMVCMVIMGCSSRALENGLALDLVADDGHAYTILIPRMEDGLRSQESSQLPGIIYVHELDNADVDTVPTVKGLSREDLAQLLSGAQAKYAEACQAAGNCLTGH